MNRKLMTAALLLALLPAGALRADPVARAQNLGDTVQLEIAGAAGWVCALRVELPRRSSGSAATTAAARSQRMNCSDGSTALLRASRDATRREWTLTFTHKTHGRAGLRAVEN